MYSHGEDGECLLLGVYVDKLIMTGACTKIISKFKEEMSSKLFMSNLALLTLYLCIEVKEEPRVITFKPAVFADKLLEKAGMSSCNAAVSQTVQGELQCTCGRHPIPEHH